MGFDPATISAIVGLGGLALGAGGLGYSIYAGEKGKEDVPSYEPPDLTKVDPAAGEAAAKRRRALAGRYGRKQTDITGGMNMGLGNILKKRLGG